MKQTTSRLRLRTIAAILIAAPILIVGTVAAAEKTVKVIIQDVDEQDRTISVLADEDGKSLQLDLIRKTKIAVANNDAKSSDLQFGQAATVTYDSDLAVVTKIAAAPFDPPKGQIELFNGTDLDGWKFVVPPRYPQTSRERDCWDVNVERRSLIAKGLGTTWLATESAFDNFVLSFEWRFPVDGLQSPNGSGVVVRAAGLFSNEADPRGVEIDFAESKTGDFICYGTPLTNSKRKIVGETQQRLERLSVPELKPMGKWNRAEIRCDQDQIAVKLNGTLVNEATNARIKKGEICFRSQNTAVEFRKIRLTPIVAPAETQ